MSVIVDLTDLLKVAKALKDEGFKLRYFWVDGEFALWIRKKKRPAFLVK